MQTFLQCDIKLLTLFYAVLLFHNDELLLRDCSIKSEIVQHNWIRERRMREKTGAFE